jgi:hypothetical protein
VILSAAAILRFMNYASFSYSNDELSAINRLQYDTFNDLVSKGFYVDGHPGGIQVFLWYWSSWFGFSEAALRLPFVIMGILAVLFSYLVARRMLGKVAGLFTAATLSFLQFPLLYSQIARPYGSGLFFVLFLLYFWLKVIDPDRQEKVKCSLPSYVGLTLGFTACMYNHYFSFLMALIIGISGLFMVERKKLIPYLVSGLLAILLFLPHLGITLNHLTYRGVGLWLGKPTPAFLTEHLSYVFEDSVFILALVLIASVLLSWKSERVEHSRKIFFLLFSWFILPLLAGYLYSVYVNPILQHSVLIFSFPFLVMMLFMAAGEQFGRNHRILLAVYLVAGITGTVFVNRYYSKQHFGEFKGIAKKSCQWQQHYNKDSITSVTVANSPNYLKFYLEKLDCNVSFAMTDIRNADDLNKLAEIVKGARTPYFLYSWTKPSPEAVEDIIRGKFPFIEKSIHFGNLSAITLYGKRNGSLFEKDVPLELLYMDSLKIGPPETKSEMVPGRKGASVIPFIKLDSLSEYSRGMERSMDEFAESGALKIVCEARVKSDFLPTGGFLIASVEQEGGTPAVWKASLLDHFLMENEVSVVRLSSIIESRNCKNAKLKVYLWNPGKKKFEIAGLSYRVYRYLGHSPFDPEQRIYGDIKM